MTCSSQSYRPYLSESNTSDYTLDGLESGLIRRYDNLVSFKDGSKAEAGRYDGVVASAGDGVVENWYTRHLLGLRCSVSLGCFRARDRRSCPDVRRLVCVVPAYTASAVRHPCPIAYALDPQNQIVGLF